MSKPSNASVVLPFTLAPDSGPVALDGNYAGQRLDNSHNYMTAWAAITVILMCIGWLGNLLSLYSALVSSRVRISFYYLLANLSFLYLIVCCPLYMVFVSNQLRQFNVNIPQSACNFICFFNNVLRAGVNQTYALLAIDQLMFVRWPAEHDEHRMSVRRVKWLIALTYALAFFVELFAAIGHSAMYRRIRYICVTDAFDITWAVFWYILFCAIPFLLTTFCYIGVMYFFKHRRAFAALGTNITTTTIQNGAGGFASTDGNGQANVDNGYFRREIITRTTITNRNAATNSIMSEAISHKRFHIALSILALTVVYVVSYVVGSLMLNVPLDKQTAAWGYWLSWIMAIIHPFVWPVINAQFRQTFRDSANDIAQRSAEFGFRVRQLPRSVPNKLRAFRAFQLSVLAPSSTNSIAITDNGNALASRSSISVPPVVSSFNNNSNAKYNNVSTKRSTGLPSLAIAPVRRSTIISVEDEVGSVTPATKGRNGVGGTNPFEKNYYEAQKPIKSVERVLGIQNEQIP